MAKLSNWGIRPHNIEQWYDLLGLEHNVILKGRRLRDWKLARAAGQVRERKAANQRRLETRGWKLRKDSREARLDA